MPALFTLPSQIPLSTSGELLAGCTLTFSISGSSTAQNTYQDISLSVPHANPVVADGSGAFGAIYLDPTLPNYRVVLKTQAGVVLKTWEDVPSNQNTAQTFRLKATAPSLTFEETDAAANNKVWRLKVDGEQMLLTILNDAESVETTVFTFDRTGTVVDGVDFAGQYLKVGGVIVATQESGSFTATLSGFTTTVTGTCQWKRSGSKIALLVPSAITGTSNATSMNMTGMPSSIKMATTRARCLCIVRDNGAEVLGVASIQLTADSNSISFGVGAAAGNFTNSGTKGLSAGTLILWDSDATSIA
jgi:hypothetical protein